MRPGQCQLVGLLQILVLLFADENVVDGIHVVHFFLRIGDDAEDVDFVLEFVAEFLEEGVLACAGWACQDERDHFTFLGIEGHEVAAGVCLQVAGFGD
eukprot:CAMPEP_0116937772 /NCGR_PEP_ID=MMETSP0467-20121206/31700_1 /TAXON_ID=283647 /ORGANISM="Mesodinium pulex, Strain SPMC105" /LENGTH=97 /DNA_ID=CAMNT_0004619645 /DNA_START=429 /DNA_END=722 /DNA_ORIENTATION=-